MVEEHGVCVRVLLLLCGHSSGLFLFYMHLRNGEKEKFLDMVSFTRFNLALVFDRTVYTKKKKFFIIKHTDIICVTGVGSWLFFFP